MSEELGIFEVMFNCRAMRRLSGEPVPEEHLLKLVEAAGQAATGGNTQRNRWIIVRDPDQKKKLADLNRVASEEFVRDRIERGESLPHHDAQRRKRMLESVLWLAHHMHEIHALFVACYQFDAKPTETDMARAPVVAVAGGAKSVALRACAGVGRGTHQLFAERPGSICQGVSTTGGYGCVCVNTGWLPHGKIWTGYQVTGSASDAL